MTSFLIFAGLALALALFLTIAHLLRSGHPDAARLDDQRGKNRVVASESSDLVKTLGIKSTRI